MKIAYVAESGEKYYGLQSDSAIDRRRLAALESIWQTHGHVVVPWVEGINCDLIYIVNAQRSIKAAENVLAKEHHKAAVVVGIIEDVLSGQWASIANEAVNNIEKLTKEWIYSKSSLKGRLKSIRDYLARVGIIQTRHTKLIKILSRTDAIICTSELQAATLRHVNPFCDGIADCIPNSDYSVKNKKFADEIIRLKKDTGTVCLVWEGTAWGLQLLETIREPLEEVNKLSSIPIMLVVVMPKTRPSSLFGSQDNGEILKARFKMPTLLYEWESETVGALLRSCDIGVSPMPSINPFYRAKAFSKPLVFMSLGIPVVASDIPSYRELINHGVSGFIAKRDEDWITHIQELVNDKNLRLRIGHAALKRVDEFHSVEKMALDFLSSFIKAKIIWQIKTN